MENNPHTLKGIPLMERTVGLVGIVKQWQEVQALHMHTAVVNSLGYSWPILKLILTEISLPFPSLVSSCLSSVIFFF